MESSEVDVRLTAQQTGSPALLLPTLHAHPSTIMEALNCRPGNSDIRLTEQQTSAPTLLLLTLRAQTSLVSNDGGLGAMRFLQSGKRHGMT